MHTHLYSYTYSHITIHANQVSVVSAWHVKTRSSRIQSYEVHCTHQNLHTLWKAQIYKVHYAVTLFLQTDFLVVYRNYSRNLDRFLKTHHRNTVICFFSLKRRRSFILILLTSVSGVQQDTYPKSIKKMAQWHLLTDMCEICWLMYWVLYYASTPSMSLT